MNARKAFESLYPMWQAGEKVFPGDWRDKWEAFNDGWSAAIRALPTKEPTPAHTDHPSRDWDRTCPACVAESAAQQVPTQPQSEAPSQAQHPEPAALAGTCKPSQSWNISMTSGVYKDCGAKFGKNGDKIVPLADTQQNAAPGQVEATPARVVGRSRPLTPTQPAPDTAPGLPEWTVPRITQLRERAESAERECKWFRDACSVLGFDAPGEDGCNPLKERLDELLAAERRLRELEREIIVLNGIIKVRAGGANA